MPSASRSVRGEQRRFLASSLSLMCIFIDLLFISAPSRCYSDTYLSPSRFFAWFDSTVYIYFLTDALAYILHLRNHFKREKKKRRVDFLGAISAASQTLVQLCTRSKGHDFLLAKVTGARRKSCSSSSSSTHQSVLVEIFMTKFSPSFRVID